MCEYAYDVCLPSTYTHSTHTHNGQCHNPSVSQTNMVRPCTYEEYTEICWLEKWKIIKNVFKLIMIIWKRIVMYVLIKSLVLFSIQYNAREQKKKHQQRTRRLKKTATLRPSHSKFFHRFNRLSAIYRIYGMGEGLRSWSPGGVGAESQWVEDSSLYSNVC